MQILWLSKDKLQKFFNCSPTVFNLNTFFMPASLNALALLQLRKNCANALKVMIDETLTKELSKLLPPINVKIDHMIRRNSNFDKQITIHN